MVRSELESKLAEQNPNILRKDIEKIVNVILIAISEALVKGENIEIHVGGPKFISIYSGGAGGGQGKTLVGASPLGIELRGAMVRVQV